MATDPEDLPFVDEYRTLVDAPADVVWRALGRALNVRAPLAAGAVATLLGAQSRSGAGDPLRQGSTVPGFTVVAAEPARRLALGGSHRFSRYALIFTLIDRNGQTQLAARTRALFPGLRGRVYRALVIGSGGHRVLLTRMLRGVRRAAESADR